MEEEGRDRFLCRLYGGARLFTTGEIDAIETQVEQECEEAVEYAQAAEALTFEEAKELVFATEENI